VNAAPEDSTYNEGSSVFGTAFAQLGATGNYIVYRGAGNTVTVTGLSASTTYHFASYEYNDGGVPGASNYLITPLSIADATTPSSLTGYTWSGGSGSWITASNWTPQRTAPSNTDVLQFNNGSTMTITDVPAETIGRLIVSANTSLSLQSAAAATLTIAGLPSVTDLDVSAGSQLLLNGTSPLTLNVATGATGTVNGALSFSNAAHRLTAADASAVTFGNGAVFTAGTGFTGSPFGTSGTANAMVFANGSTYTHGAGANPFGLTQPASLVVFQTGSLYRVTGTSVTPAFNGRTYSNIEFSGTGNSTMTGAAAVTLDNLTVNSGTVNVNMTTASGHAIKGNIQVALGATLNFAPTSAGTMSLNGTATQSISNSGTLTFGANSTIEINNASDVAANSPVNFNTLTLTAGKLVLGANNVSANLINGGSATSYIRTNMTGEITVNNVAAVSKNIPVGNSTYNPLAIVNGSGLNWSARVEDALNNVVAPFNTDKAINRTWHISPSATVVAGPNISFQFDDADPGQLANAVAYNADGNRLARFWHYSGAWVSASGSIPMTPTAGPQTLTLAGYTSFSPFAIAKTTGALPVAFGNIRAAQQGSGVKIDWSNYTETDILDYTVERSANGRDFSLVGIATPRKNDGSSVDYSLIDASPVNGINYYRIRAAETNGRVKHSIVVKVDLRAGKTEIGLYPNPLTGNNLSLQATNLAKGQYNIKVFNATGQQVAAQVLNHNGGSVTEPVQLPSVLKAGLYQVVITGDIMNWTKTFVIQ
jgi:hypothetical protein